LVHQPWVDISHDELRTTRTTRCWSNISS